MVDHLDVRRYIELESERRTDIGRQYGQAAHEHQGELRV